MRTIIRKLFGNIREVVTKSSFRPQLEGLETRLAPAISLTNGNLHVEGTAWADRIYLEEVQGVVAYQRGVGPIYGNFIEATIRDAKNIIREQQSFNANFVTKITVIGGEGGDLIENNTYKSSELHGGDHDDTIYGGGADDILRGGNGNDSLHGRAGNDTFIADHGASYQDSFWGGLDSDTYVFDNLPNTSPPNYYPDPNDFSDVIIHEDTSDAWGVDTLDFTRLAATVVEPQFPSWPAVVHGVSIRLNSTAWQQVSSYLNLQMTQSTGIENIMGSDAPDVLVGNSRDNRLEGNDGKDWLEGGAGNDVLIGGAGNDEYIFWTTVVPLTVPLGTHGTNLGSDTIEEVDYMDADKLDFSYFTNSGIVLDLQSKATQNVGQNLSIKLSGSEAIEHVFGTDFADDIWGNGRANWIRANGGDDFIHGRDGNDDLRGDDGNDTICGGNGRDELRGGDDNDVLYSDEVSGDNDGQDDTLIGGAGYDWGYDDGFFYYNPS